MNRIRILLFATLLLGILHANNAVAQNDLTYESAIHFTSTSNFLNARTWSLVYDSQGNLLVGGYFTGSMDIDPNPDSVHTLSGPANMHGFLAKYAPDGSLLWTVPFINSSGSQVNDIVVDSNDDIVIVGAVYANSPDMDPGPGTVTLSTSRWWNTFVAKYSAAGEYQWAHPLTGSDQVLPIDLVLDAQQHIHVVGYRFGTINDFDPDPDNTVSLPKMGNLAGYYAQYTPSGEFVDGWAFGSAGRELFNTVDVDTQGNLYLGGYYESAYPVDADLSEAIHYLDTAGQGTFTGMVISYDSTGGFRWAQSFPSTSPNNAINALRLDGAGNLYTSGKQHGMHCTSKLSSTGSLLWQDVAPVATSFVAYDIVITPTHGVIAGSMCPPWSGAVDFEPGPDSLMLTSSGSGYTVDIRQLSADGELEWLTHIPNGKSSSIMNYEYTPSGDLLVSYNGGNSGFDPTLGADSSHVGQLNIASVVTYTLPDMEEPLPDMEEPYLIGQYPLDHCGEPGTPLWLPVVANEAITGDVAGLDICLNYDPALVTPTGKVELGPVVLNASSGMRTTTHVDTDNHTLRISIYLGNGSADDCANPDCSINGAGELVRAEFTAVAPLDGTQTLATSCGIQEGHAAQSVEAVVGTSMDLMAPPNTGLSIYWEDEARPLRYNAESPGDYNATTITPLNSAGEALPSVTPDDQGAYQLPMEYSGYTIARDIDGSYNDTVCADVQAYINGMDIQHVKYITTYNTAYKLSGGAFQLLAMDVNQDGQVGANDASLIMQRTLGVRCEFPQAWNYDVEGLAEPSAPSLDWVFVDRATVESNPSWQKSSAWPLPDGSGYSTTNMPVVPNTLLPDSSNALCPDLTVHAILLGDVDGSWSAATGVNLRQQSQASITLDTRAVSLTLPDGSGAEEGYVYLPVRVSSADPILALDLNLPHEQAGGRVAQVVYTPQFEKDFNYGTSPAYLGFRLTSWTEDFQGISSPAGAVMYLKLPDVPGKPLVDPATAKAWVNGVPAQIQGLETLWDMPENTLHAYPNPTTGEVTLFTEAMALTQGTVTIADLSGRTLQQATVSLLRGKTTIDLSTLPTGSYFITLTGDDGNRYHTRVIVSD